MTTVPRYWKIADLTTTLPNSGNPFQLLERPAFDGSWVVFMGSNQTYEGIYASRFAAPQLAIISDNHTAIGDLGGPPTGNDAYVAPVAGPLSLEDSLMMPSRPHPLVSDGNVVFFAQNSPSSGIFTIKPGAEPSNALQLVSNSNGYFSSGQFREPSGIYDGEMYFTAAGSSSAVTPGVYSVPLDQKLPKPKQLLDITTAITPAGVQIANIGNGRLLADLEPADSNSIKDARLVVYGEDSNSFSYAFSHSEQNGLRVLVNGGQEFIGVGRLQGKTFTVPTNSPGLFTQLFFSEFSSHSKMLTFTCALQQDGGVNGVVAIPDCGATITNPSEAMVIANYGESEFNGNAFAIPSVCDGERVAFAAISAENFGDLYVCNLKKEPKKWIKVLDSSTQIDGMNIQAVSLNTGCFVNGRLACRIYFQAPLSDPLPPCGIFVIDLSEY